MKSRPDYGVLLISIDVAADASASHHEGIAADTVAVSEATRWLLGLLDECRLPATWFLAGPSASVLRSFISSAAVRHEIGLLVAESCQSQEARFEFSRSLERRLLAARAAGIEISSLATREPRPIEHLDLLVKHGIRAVRQCNRHNGSESGRRVGWPAVSTLRFGITNLPATLSDSYPPRWRYLPAGWDMRRQIARAAERRQYCHLALDVHNVLNMRARKRLRATLRGAGRQFEKAGRRIETVSSLAAGLMARPIVRGAQSILRAA
jgi:hypothetical protein